MFPHAPRRHLSCLQQTMRNNIGHSALLYFPPPLVNLAPADRDGASVREPKQHNQWLNVHQCMLPYTPELSRLSTPLLRTAHDRHLHYSRYTILGFTRIVCSDRNTGGRNGSIHCRRADRSPYKESSRYIFSTGVLEGLTEASRASHKPPVTSRPRLGEIRCPVF